ncbi:arylamine N-acetyltransferase nat [Mycobacterium tuberculosis variant africanum K85]|uniref:Arylamine N-acetyltransferase nat n=8 Tax=Mycobacterium tuberculosis TaxID=1773 RepID=A0A9P2H429_MYCTX|nr:arylamine N-acetyltransferase nat [Mycobacterium tuberculosis variant africanum K85]
MARADAKSPILRACWAILRLLAVAGKQSGEPRPVCRVVGAAVLADGEYADAYVKEQHCRRSVRRGLPCRPSRHRPASLRCRGSAIASVTGIMMRCCVRRRSSDPPGIRPDGASSHRMGECQRAVCRSRRHVSLRGHFVCRRPRNSCGKPQSVRHSWPAARRTPEYPAVGPTRRRGQNGNMALDLTAYFDRINYRGATDPTLDVLQDLVTVHSRTIPFENLDPLLGVPVDDLSPQALADKLVLRRRGGYCFEHNGLMGYVLAELGYRVRRFAARVVWKLAPDAPLPPQTHTLLGVTFPGSGGCYLVDVGFGGQTPTSPLRLETGAVQPTTHEPYRLEDRVDGFVLQAMVRDTWQTLYEFTTQTRPQIDLKVASWYASTHPASKFVTGLTAAVITDDARWNLSGRDLAVHRAGGTEKIRLADAAAVVDTLSKRFGINVADIGERGALETRIDELLARQPGADAP